MCFIRLSCLAMVHLVAVYRLTGCLLEPGKIIGRATNLPCDLDDSSGYLRGDGSPGSATCKASGRTSDYRQAIVISLAPGGIAKARVREACLPPLELEAKAHIEKHGIPYGSW